MRDRISIIIVYKDGRKPISVSIKRKHLKIFLGTIFMLFLLYPINFAFMKYSIHVKREVESKEQTLREKEAELSLLVENSRVINEKAKVLEENLQKIEDYLAKRGVISSRPAVGGYSSTGPKDAAKLLEAKIERAKNIQNIIQSVPLGYPAYGEVSSHFGWRKNPFGKGYEFHTGIDIVVPYGYPVRATAEGVVEYVGRMEGYGITVVIRHASAYIAATYSP